VHFTEASVRAAASQNTTVTTPWIAYISCDGNETDASEWDGAFLGPQPPRRAVGEGR
jgi:hypothetical protein